MADGFIVSRGAMSSHDDFDIFESVDVGINESFELVVRLEAHLYGIFREGLTDNVCWVEAYASRDAAYDLSRNMNVSMVDLPAKMVRRCAGARGDDVFPEAGEMRECFFELVAMLDAHDCPYRIRHKYATGPTKRVNIYKDIR